jgi:hypothetical protein
MAIRKIKIMLRIKIKSLFGDSRMKASTLLSGDS